ncbi:BON domain-containing protein [Cupriavidus sp. 30B13]|uniref:BON domain-containing protein n=1 Tax=Cupriavidus sp. 30B13 TaxID=3384241 RepID=UPI003B91AC63
MMRTDTQLQRDVMAELRWESSINAAQIGVEVSDGVVTLAGHVGSFAEKHSAERAVQRVKGVKALAVEIDVRLTGASERNDVDIARTAKNVLEWTSFVPKDSVDVMVENGWITLSGLVGWDHQKQAAVAAVRDLMGVRGVSNQIEVRSPVSIGAVRADIEAALTRRSTSEARDIAVSVKGTEVTLTGTVHTWSERELLTHAAWSTPGVCRVVDKISIVD